MQTIFSRFIALAILVAPSATPMSAQTWQGFADASGQLETYTFSFTGDIPEARDDNENYYDGDFADFDGDGLMDRGLGSRYGLLKNTGGGLMTPYAGPQLVNYLFRGYSPGWGEDAFQWADVDNDGDMDILQGGNGEPFTLQINSGGRFRTKWIKSGSALNIVNIDIEGDGDVDLAVAHAFCSDPLCGHGCPDENCQGGTWPKQFHLWVNDGTGNYTDEVDARGFPRNFGTNLIVGVVAGDVDGDRDFDLLLINGIQRGITLARNNGSGVFSLSLIPNGVPIAAIRPITSGFHQGMNLGDIDDDGDLDLVCALDRDSAGTPHPSVGHAVFVNDGAGNFVEETLQRFDATGAPGFLSGGNGTLADLDYDGDLDFFAFKFKPDRLFQVFLNNGTGQFTYSTLFSTNLPGDPPGSVTGADNDVTDIDGDGDYDVWIGAAGSDPRILLNRHVTPDGLPANLPGNPQVVSATTNGITLSWQHPNYRDLCRSYRVYRSMAPGLALPDRHLLKWIAISRFQDEGFAAPITRFTTTAYLNDPDVVLTGSSNLVQFIDRTAVSGVRYYYSIVHVGTENTASRPTAEVEAIVPVVGGTDTTAPSLDIISPTVQDWSAYPRIVIQYADGQSGIDTSSLSVSIDAALGSGDAGTGGRAAGAELSDLGFRKDASAFITVLQPPLSISLNTLATLTASVSDLAGNRVTNDVRFFVSVAPGTPPTPALEIDPTNGIAPLRIALSAAGSSDSDGKVFRTEWYFSDGTTAIGANVEKIFNSAGDEEVTLVVRDSSGAVASTSRFVSVGALTLSNPRLDAAGFSFDIETVVGANYLIERSTSLVPPSWSFVGMVAGDGTLKTFTDTNVPAAGGFYRGSAR